MFTCLSRKSSKPKPIPQNMRKYQSLKIIKKINEKKVIEKPKIENFIFNEEIQEQQKKQCSPQKVDINRISEIQSKDQISAREVNIESILVVPNQAKQKFNLSDGAQNVNESLVSQTHQFMFNDSAFGTTSFGLGIQLNQFELKKQILDVVQNLTRRPTFLPRANQNSVEGMKKNYSQSFIQQSQEKVQQNIKRTFSDINLQFTRALIQRNYQESANIFKQMNNIEKNQPDKFGFTPLYLATLISIFQTDGKALEFFKKIIKDQTINPTKKIPKGSKAIQEAILFKNIPVLTNLFRSSYCYRINQIKKSLKQFALILTQLPDMELQFYVKVGSFVPLVDKLTPDDTIKIYKRGKNLRIDYSLVGYTFLQSKRRHMSCIIQKLQNEEYTILVINHDKKCYTDLFDPFTNQELILIIQDLLCSQIKRTSPVINKTSMKLEHNIFEETIKQYISTGVAIKHQLKVTYTSNTQKLQPKSKKAASDLEFLRTWENYSGYQNISHAKKKKKQLKLGVWLCKESPLKLDQLLHIMKFLSFAHEGGEIVYNFLNDQKIKNTLSGFPMKIQIPMSFSLFLDIKISNIILREPDIQFQFTNKYERQKRVDYQKTLLRKQKRAAIIKFYT